MSHCCLSGLFWKSHSEPLKILSKPQESHDEPLRATEKSCSFLKFQVRGGQGPALPSSLVTGVREFHVRGFCSRIILGRAGALVNCSIRACVHCTSNKSHQGSQKSRTHLLRDCHCPVDAACSCGAIWLVVFSRLNRSSPEAVVPLEGEIKKRADITFKGTVPIRHVIIGILPYDKITNLNCRKVREVCVFF